MKKWTLPLLFAGGAIIIFSSSLKKIMHVVPGSLDSVVSQDSNILDDVTDSNYFESFDDFFGYMEENGNQKDPNEPNIESGIESMFESNGEPSSSYKDNIYPGQEYFRIKNLGKGSEKIVFNGDYQTHLDNNEGKYAQGYIIQLFRDDKCVETIKNLPDYFTITNLLGFTERNIFERDYLEYVEEHKDEYPWGYRVKIFWGNDLVKEIEHDLGG